MCRARDRKRAVDDSQLRGESQLAIVGCELDTRFNSIDRGPHFFQLTGCQTEFFFGFQSSLKRLSRVGEASQQVIAISDFG